MQSGALIAYFLESNPYSLVEAYKDVTGRGSGWRTRLISGMEQMDKYLPDLQLRERFSNALADYGEDGSNESLPAPK